MEDCSSVNNQQTTGSILSVIICNNIIAVLSIVIIIVPKILIKLVHTSENCALKKRNKMPVVYKTSEGAAYDVFSDSIVATMMTCNPRSISTSTFHNGVLATTQMKKDQVNKVSSISTYKSKTSCISHMLVGSSLLQPVEKCTAFHHISRNQQQGRT